MPTINETVDRALGAILAAIKRFDGKSVTPLSDQKAKELRLRLELIRAIALEHEPARLGQIVDALEYVRRFPMVQLTVATQDEKADLANLSHSAAEGALTIVSHPDYKPPRKYP